MNAHLLEREDVTQNAQGWSRRLRGQRLTQALGDKCVRDGRPCALIWPDSEAI